MCEGCWWGDHGAPVVATGDVLATAELIRRLYEDFGQLAGGPLHAMLDDMNIDDEQVESDHHTSGQYAQRMTWDTSQPIFKSIYHDELDCAPEVKDLCELILASFRRMPESHRAAAIAWHRGWAWEHIEQLAGETLIGGPPFVSDAGVDELIAELRADMAKPDGHPDSKACISIPCPPFQGISDALSGHGMETQPAVAEPSKALASTGYGDPAFWDGVRTVRPDEMGTRGEVPGEWVMSSEPDARIDLTQIPLSRAMQAAMPGEWMMRPTLTDPALIPKIVRVPEDIDIEDACRALGICRRLGILIDDSPAGHIFIPAGVLPPEQS